jgi:hypothetical protein
MSISAWQHVSKPPGFARRLVSTSASQRSSGRRGDDLFEEAVHEEGDSRSNTGGDLILKGLKAEMLKAEAEAC